MPDSIDTEGVAAADDMPSLLQRVQASPRMPSLPAVAAQVLDLVEEEEVDLGRIAEVVSKDAALATRVLRTVNSSFYGQAYSVGTVGHALVVLGLRAVKTLTLGFSLVETFNRKSGESEAFDVAAYWRRSLLSAVAAKQLAEAIRLDTPEECFLGGLLRDVGVMCLQQSLGMEYEDVLAEATSPHGPWGEALARAEVEAFGMHHASLAAELCRKWRLPPLLTGLIEHHHRPEEAPADQRLAVACVHAGGLAAGVFMAELDEGTEGDSHLAGTALARFRDAAERLGTDAGFPVEPEALLDQVHNHFAEFRRLFDLPRTAATDDAALLRRAREAQEAAALSAARDADRLEGETERLRVDSELDALTKLPNRRRFDRELEAHCAPGAAGFSMLMLDIDHFKTVNDTHGHDVGDAVLIAVAAEVAAVSGRHEKDSLCCRLGGEEFAVLVADGDLLAAARLADRIRAAVARVQTPVADGTLLAVTLSAGVCLGVGGQSPAEVYKWADRALYAAKEGGRDTIRAYRAAA